MKIPWWAMYVVIEDKDFAEAVDIATESFVEHILGQISNLRLSDDGEREVKSLSKHKITKKASISVKTKDLTPFLKLRAGFRTEPHPGFLFCLKQSPELLVPADQYTFAC